MNHNDCPSSKCSFSATCTTELSKHKLVCRNYKAWNKRRVERGIRRLMNECQRLQDLAMEVCNAPSKMVACACYWEASNILYRYRHLLMSCIWMRVLST